MLRAVAKIAGYTVLTICSWPSPAHAAEKVDSKAEESKAEDSDALPSEGATDDDKKDEKSEAKSESKDDGKKKSADAAPSDDSPVELPGKTYRFVGLRYRGIVVPQFYQGIFASGGRTIYVNGFGPEFAIRRDNFEYNLSAWLGFYSMGDTAFKGKSDADTAWELINANLDILYLTSDFMWSHPFTPEWALNYGAGVGFGFVFGSLHRVQSYPTAPGQNPNNYSKCTAPFVPDPTYCDNSNGHYGSYSEPSWASNGSKPILFPWLAVQTGVRFKPSRRFVARLDVGFGTSGFFFGLGGDYGL